VPPDVRETDPEGVDYGWIMQVTFVVTILVGSPLVAIASLFAAVPTWSDRATFALRVCSAIWFLTLLGTYAYARKYRSEEPTEQSEESTERTDEPQ